MIDVALELSRLRYFQRATADYAFERLFGAGAESGSRFLVADEVGLGKTMVARGVIAQTIEHLQVSGDERVDIVYICSNGAIAAQNLRKLAPAGAPVEHRSERLPLLAFRLSRREQHPVNLIALTPGTAFAKGWATGQVEERAAVLRALQQLWGGRRVMGRGIGRIFAAGIGPGSYASKDARIRALAAEQGNLSPEALEIFGREVGKVNARRAQRGDGDLDTALHHVAERFARTDDPGRAAVGVRNELISELRSALAMTGAHLLHPDIVVLDEFQRFRDILHGTGEADYAAEVARQLFEYHDERFDRTTRILLLSATPYVMHTTSAEATAGGNHHYKDFLETYGFLAAGLPGVDPEQAKADLGRELSALRSTLLDAPTSGVQPAIAAAHDVSERLRKVMVRTERLASTPDRDGMLRQVDEDLAVPSRVALAQYVATDRVAQHVVAISGRQVGDVVEYWKAAPYTLSYLGAHTYQLAEQLRALAGDGSAVPDTELLSMLRHSEAVLPWDEMRTYQPVDPAHEGLARLWHDFFDEAQAHLLLWMPASLPYYESGGIFESAAAQRLTKRLIFSSWTLVPTAIATLSSYECERRLHDAARDAGAVVHDYDDELRNTTRLRFGVGTQSMAHLQFVVPSPALARLADPWAESVRLRREGRVPTLETILADVTTRIRAALEPLIGHLPVGRGAGSTAWYTLAPALLDGDGTLSMEGLRDEDDEGTTALDRHLVELERLLSVAQNPDTTPDDLPPLPADLAEVLALRSVAGPSTVLIRAFERSFASAGPDALVAAAAYAAEGFRSLFNSTEANQALDAFDGPGEYWLTVLRYCAVGNLQAVVDELCSVLVENRGYDRAPDQAGALADLARDVRTTLGLSALYRPAVVTDQQDGDGPRWRQLRLRGRFALRYGTTSTEEKAEQRSADVGLAFNSPFWPFILASTSVGQEGLDFHQYAHAVSHWNLPGNPVDLEQREGRIHRYKGHAVRKNVARALPFPVGEGHPWTQLFAAAAALPESVDADMVPYWVFAPVSLGGDRALIERHLPLTPFTREKSGIGSLLSSVVHYRLAFGQPRQDELVQILKDLAPETRAALGQVRVDLTPPRI
jgi:hypothetical protein